MLEGLDARTHVGDIAYGTLLLPSRDASRPLNAPRHTVYRRPLQLKMKKRTACARGIRSVASTTTRIKCSHHTHRRLLAEWDGEGGDLVPKAQRERALLYTGACRYLNISDSKA